MTTYIIFQTVASNIETLNTQKETTIKAIPKHETLTLDKLTRLCLSFRPPHPSFYICTLHKFAAENGRKELAFKAMDQPHQTLH